MSFLLGMIVGHAMSSSTPENPTTTVIQPKDPSHEVVLCRTNEDYPGLCLDRYWNPETKQQFAGNAGYGCLYGSAVVVSGDKQFFALEVGKCGRS